MMTREEIRARVEQEENFVNAKRFKNDLATLEKRYPEGCPDHVIAAALMIPIEWVPGQYNYVVRKLRKLMGVKA